MRLLLFIGLLIIGVFLAIAPYDALQPSGSAQVLSAGREASIERLQDSLRGRGHIKRNRATKVADFVRLDRATSGTLDPANVGMTVEERSLAFLTEHRQGFGLINAVEELKLTTEQRDRQGGVHLSFNQTYKGVPVFAGVLKTHFNSAGELRAVNGVIVPDIHLNPIPSRSSEEAAAFALAKLQSDSRNGLTLSVRGAKLFVYRTGLANGVTGENHLVWEVEVSNNGNVHEFVYVDAHSGKLVDQLTGKYDALDRRIYDGQNIPVFLPPGFPSNPFWTEGQPFPTGIANADEVIAASKETYDLFKNGFGRDSFDNLGSTMFSVFDSGWIAGNAQAWPILHLTLISKELATDDVVAHEWIHVYTYYTNSLVYQSQPGALNEAFSDIFAETVDLLNGRGLDTPGGPRAENECAYSKPILHVNSPAAVQGDYVTAPALFGPHLTSTGITGKVVLVDDGVGRGMPPDFSRTDGCETPYRNASQVNGNIALIDRTESGTCTYPEKVHNAQLNGAIAVIIANDIVEGNQPTPMAGIDPAITIPSVAIGYDDGQALRQPHLQDVFATMKADGTPINMSYRWQMAEDSIYGALRDMRSPRCYANPAKTSDREYFCGSNDQGGVHENSGIPNHAYALMTDGGAFNGQTIQPIGLTKAAHIHFRAMTLYLTPTSDFSDHAEALEAAAADLIGINLPSLITGLPSGEVISAVDVEQVHRVTLAVELRNPPTQCGLPTVLTKDPPADNCPAEPITGKTIFGDDFEHHPLSSWTISREVGSTATFIARDWSFVKQLPDRAGSGFFGPDPIDDCTSPPPGQVGVLHLDSPLITLPRVMLGGPHLSFDHWVALERGYDGGQLKISVNGGPYRLVEPPAFTFNAYNTNLFPPIPGYELLFSPSAGEPAFSGTDEASFKGSWGTSIVDLTRYARSGDRIRLRWDLSTDYCFGTNHGWYLDNVRVYACQP
jgi:Zn-dependent metalloprotease